MKEKKHFITQILRHVIQIAAFLLFPGLFLTVFNAIRDIIRSAISGSFTFAALSGPLLILITVLLVTILWGRFFCGYLCSFGAVQELLARLSDMLRIRRNKLPLGADRILKKVKYAVLILIVLFIWILQLPIDSSFSPWGIFGMLTSGYPQTMRAAIPTFGFVLLLAIAAASFFIERFFCRYLCPLGALFALISGKRLFVIRRLRTRCNGCTVCTRNCAMDITIHNTDYITNGECINCMRCLVSCKPSALFANPSPALTGTVSALIMGGMVSVGNVVTSFAKSVEQPKTTVSAETDSSATENSGANASKSTISVTGTLSAGLSETSSAKQEFEKNSSFENSTQAIESEEVYEEIPSEEEIVSEEAQTNSSSEGSWSFEAVEEEPFYVEEENTEEFIEYESTEESGFEEDFSEESSFEEAVYTESDESDDETTGFGYADGEYIGYGSGFRGTTTVSVTVSGGTIVDITVLSYDDDTDFFSRAEGSMIQEILAGQGIDVATVSGATFSSNSILEAVANALGIPFENPNSSMGGHGRR